MAPQAVETVPLRLSAGDVVVSSVLTDLRSETDGGKCFITLNTVENTDLQTLHTSTSLLTNYPAFGVI